MIDDRYDKFIIGGAVLFVLGLLGTYAYNYIALVYEMLQLHI